jgi:streptomycin 6-kinase
MTDLPETFARRIMGTFGQEGLQWLGDLPSILESLSCRWSLTLLPPFEGMSYNYVAPAICGDGSQVVLKVGVPNRELQTEMEALRIFNGRGAVRLIESDDEKGALLLERLRPGQTVLCMDDDVQATTIAGQLMRRLWGADVQGGIFPFVEDWSRGLAKLRIRFDGGTGPFPKPLVEAAENLFQDLLASSNEPTILHGDLHHWNILSAEREPWLAIDPKGVIGEPAY